MQEDEFKKFLPQYLSEDDQNRLFSGLANFPQSFLSKAYTTKLQTDEIIYQGDGYSQMPHSKLPTAAIKEVNTIVLSNTCDLSFDNHRYAPPRIVQAPIIELSKFRDLLFRLYVDTNKMPSAILDTYIETIKKQRINQYFFLPKTSFIEDSIVPLDNVSSLPSDYISKDQITKKRLFSLSDYGFYVFLYKLSIHFTRMKENVARG